MSLAAEYETAQTLGANRGDIPATGTCGDASSHGGGGVIILEDVVVIENVSVLIHV
jgi:hypothetical protein